MDDGRLHGGCGFGPHRLLFHRRAEPIDRLLVAARNQMAVEIDRDLYRRVPRLLFDVDRAFSLLEEE